MFWFIVYKRLGEYEQEMWYPDDFLRMNRSMTQHGKSGWRISYMKLMNAEG